MTTSKNDLLGHYLQAIGLLLPAGERADILRELRGNLEAQLEDQAEALGRELTEDEICVFIKNHGHPAAVAARYRPTSYLVGPQMWPYFVLGAKILAVAVAVGATFKALITTLAFGQPWVWAALPVRWVFAFLEIGFPVFSVWVLLTAVAERGRTKRGHDADWDPRELKQDGIGALATGWAQSMADGAKAVANSFTCTRTYQGMAEEVKTSARACSAALSEDGFVKVAKPDWLEEHPWAKAFGEFFGAGVALLFWYLFFHYTQFFTGGVATNLEPGPVWRENYHYIMGILAVQVGLAAIPLANPRSRPLRFGIKAVSSAVGLLVLQAFMKSPVLLTTVPVTEGMRDLSFIAEHVNRWSYPALVVFFCIGLAQALFHAGKAVSALLRIGSRS